MRRVLSVLLALAFISVTSLAYAQDAGSKLYRGLVNTATGLLELPITVIKVSKNEGYPTGLTYGLGKGLVNGVYRTLVGIYEVVTFPVPAPAGYKSIMAPETLLTSETLQKADPSMAIKFSPLSSELKGPAATEEKKKK